MIPLTEADVGTVLDCGCEVTRANFGCGNGDFDEDGREFGHSYPDTGCGDCRFGVPAVYHDEDTCALYADDVPGTPETKCGDPA